MFAGGVIVKRACDRGAGSGVLIRGVLIRGVLIRGVQPIEAETLYFPCTCGTLCFTTWAQLNEAYQRARAAGRRVLVFGVDL